MTAPQTTTYLKDYRPFPFTLGEVSLTFRLAAKATRVLATIPFTSAGPKADLVLFGEGLKPVSLRIDGTELSPHDYQLTDETLTVPASRLPSGAFLWEAEVEIDPRGNTTLEGLYMSNGMYCTQCEAEGFRHITFYPDRPDVMTTFRVRIESDLPVMLSNGNPGAQGKGFAEWHDPWPKPAYLFALVAGDLVNLPDNFTTRSGRKVDLNIWVRKGDLDRCDYAMGALKRSMKWDEDAYGREYDLDVFNLVAVDDFNMGAMENKGLNIFNSKLVLASPETATDLDFERIEGVIGHEYFHNWTGNRITCRDWFQLCLKEGLTVFRDQQFTSDMRSAPVKRIDDVLTLRARQFREDTGPLAHPVRPDSFVEINNFYTATVYEKGAEVIGMLKRLVGDDGYRKSLDLYFDRHDGEAATCEDFVRAVEDGAGLDLAQFRLWYSQAGTPKVTASLAHEDGVATLTLSQTVPDTPGQSGKQPMVIPLRLALFDRASGQHQGEQLVVLDRAEMQFAFPGFAARPVLSLNRGFSAPVQIVSDVSASDLVFLAAHDDDPFARYEALQQLVVQHLVAEIGGGMLCGAERDAAREDIVRAFKAVIEDAVLDDLMRGELMILPGEGYLAEQFAAADPGAIRAAREGLKAELGSKLEAELAALHQRASSVPYSLSAEARGARKLKTQALALLAAGVPVRTAGLAAAQFDAADNMTDRQGALMVLCGLDTPLREDKLAAFHTKFADNALVIDKWFSLQAGSLHPQVLDHVRALASHPDFTMSNPNRVRALYMAMAGNPGAFHDASGAGYRIIADLILALDPVNAQTAARFVAPLGKWRRLEPKRAALMRAELERIVAAPGLSKDSFEQVSKSLG